jgi:Zn-dependent protease with chaperone function
MDDPFRLLLTNAAAAGLIALVAWAASRTVRRQAVVHGLWLLALARLVMPPIAPLPLVPAWPGLALVSSPLSPTVVAIPPASGDGSPAVAGGRQAARVTPAPAPATRPVAPPPPTGPRLGWRSAAWLALAAGALAIALLTASRFTRFGRLLACAQPAPPALAERAARLAARLGLSRVPPVLLVPARIPPMLWPHRGGPRLLLPAGLLPDLDTDELDTLLAHELAHVRRRDHWVRLVEIAATALFWWYPVTWWARRALRRAEERCCDEWVLRLLPRSAEAYANGLLKSLTFVAHKTAALPSLASGAGPVADIEARLKEILMTRPVPRLAAPLRLTLAAAAALGLAVFPTHAQSSATKDEPAPPAPVATTPVVAKTPATPPVARPARASRATALAPVAARPALTPPPALAPRAGLPPLAALTSRPALAPVAAPDPTPQAQPAPEPVVAARPRTSDPARRALEEQRRAIEGQRRQLQQQELELQRKQLELEARAEQADLRATADRLRAEGHADEAARTDKQLELTARRMDLQRRQLGIEAERVALEAKVETEMAAQQARIEALAQGGREAEAEDAQRAMERADAERQQAEQELEKKQQAIETELMQAESQMQVLAVEDQVREMRNATDDLARSLAEQIESLKQAAAEAPSQKAAVEHEIQRIQAAIDALQSGGTPKSLPRKTPRPQP